MGLETVHVNHTDQLATVTPHRPEHREGQTADLPAMRLREDRLFAWAARQPDVKEGVAAFLERRPPQWSLRPSVDLPDA
jgi:enoyl-CoA hydratase/carnithine racemase